MDRYSEPERIWPLLPVVLATILTAMLWLRYGGYWAEVDTSVLTRATRATLAEHTVNPSEGVYLNGFTYPSLIGFLSSVTGLSVNHVQTGIAPCCLIGTAIVMFIMFRVITGSGRLAAICSCLLLVQPDFLFVNQRGSHEKVTWTLVMILLFSLVASFRRRNFSYATSLVFIFYVSGFALISTNAFFASSLITSFIVSFLGVTLATRWVLRDRTIRPFFRRLGYIFVTLSVLSYVYIVYIFPPVRANLGNLQGVVDRVSALYLDVEASISPPDPDETTPQNPRAQQGPVTTVTTAVASPYNSVALAWTNTKVYFALTSLTWILIALAAFAWMFSFYRYFRRGAPQERAPVFLMWVLAGATGVQILASVVIDAAGALGSNMQLRLFPAFTLFIIPLVVATLRVPRSLWFWARFRHVAIGAAALAFAFFVVAGYLKATNDPIVSNKWVFYTRSEVAMLKWTDIYLTDEYVWGDFDERLIVADVMLANDLPDAQRPGPKWVAGSRAPSLARYIVTSDVTAKRALRINGAMPDITNMDVLYDNGSVQVRHRIPETPYEP